MSYDPTIHHRRSIRLQSHDYAGGGAYFVTLCAARGTGKVFDPPPVRAMLAREWLALPARFPEMDADAPHAIMPDHFHGLIHLRPGKTALGDIICAFKSLADRAYRIAVRAGLASALPSAIKAADARPAPTVRAGLASAHPPAPPPAKLWHRNYYERIIHSARDLHNTTQYIRLNPARLIWHLPAGMAAGVRAGLASAHSPAGLASAHSPAGLASAHSPAGLASAHSPAHSPIPAFGNPALLDMQRLGTMASGNAPRGAAPPLPPGWTLLCGGHSGQEQQAMEHTLAHQGFVLLMPAVHPDAVALSPTQLTALSEGRLTVICPFAEPCTTRGNALLRNRRIAEWSDSLWIPSVRPGGALETLAHEYRHKCIAH